MKGRRVRSRNMEATARSPGTEGLDMISVLPQHLIEEILLRLPLRDAVRTSVLSSNWRGKWITLPRLVFHDDCLSPAVRRHPSEAIKKAIDSIFAFHQGQVETFELFLVDNRPNSSDVFRWIRHLSTLSVNKLNIYTGSDLGSCIFACQDLISLKLLGCSFRLASNFTGLKNLRKLFLSPALVAQDMLENLVSSCPQLMKLRILVHRPDAFSHLKITALNLQRIEVEGDLKAVKIDAPGLKHLKFSWHLKDIEVNTNCLLSLRLVEEGNEETIYDKADAIYRSLLEIFVRQSQLNFLSLGINFVQYLCLSGFPDTLCNSLLHLKHLVVTINFSSVKSISSTLCFLRNCPNLESIEFWKKYGSGEGVVDDVSKVFQDDSSSCLFKHLKDVWVRWISNKQAETRFIKFVLMSSPILENMVIKPVSTKGSFGLLRQLLQCTRPNRARVFYMDPDDGSREPRSKAFNDGYIDARYIRWNSAQYAGILCNTIMRRFVFLKEIYKTYSRSS